ncbi:two-component system nitrate/nitrite sensor histidine kinase NarX [Chitinivorax tropicus]|uniref:Sensor protein n=1 Tax=Chitinivorax tropicus TaxID=714531 RepID=A0A840MVQ0_9PROT|nr:type IV pili methyl-accepting chemotaxis transducer N-terminal domain-containing protein [Chitinivorax tropicus]MBB5020433.1 two-component system nitrate/nitrite sensor histidine kinase NarX [Chitinivorax tropicus]
MSMPELLPARRRLTVKIVGLLMTFMVLALVAVGSTLLLSWELEGGAAAINDAGSLRMRSYRLLEMAARARSADQVVGLQSRIQAELGEIDHIFATLHTGDPIRPLFVPGTAPVLKQLRLIHNNWQAEIRPALSANTLPLPVLRERVEQFVAHIDTEVRLIEHENSRRTTFLRASQMGLIAMGVVSTVCVIYLMFLIIIRPVTRLQAGIQAMADGEMSVRLPVESQDEFGQLTNGFNQMASRLQDLYNTLEKRVADKTLSLAEKNRELASLYDMTAFLNRPGTVEDLCRGFLQRVMQQFRADGGMVRVVDPSNGNLHVVIHEGLSNELVGQEHCLNVGDCLCGEAARDGVSVVHDMRRARLPKREIDCKKDGFVTVSIFQILSLHQAIGQFNLHFKQPYAFSAQEVQLLETFGQHLGVAIDNRRMAAREREMAVSQERNLMAQGLHDSIAQGLTFLNLQAQLMEDGIKRQDWTEVSDTMPLIRAGIQESYEDVRELLLNFRAKLGQESLPDAIRVTLDKFQRQTGVETGFMQEGQGAPLPREHQLQLLFIVQEALSNIRKHAKASQVWVQLNDTQDLELIIHDDGCGFDPETVKAKGESHVGLNIMRERALRIGALLELDTRPGDGVTWRVWLSREQRMAA